MRFNWLRPLVCLIALGSSTNCTQVPPPPLRVGTNVWPGYELLYLAREIGSLSPTVRLVEMGSATEVLFAFRHGDLDVAATTLDEAITLLADGEPISVLLITDESRGADVVLAQPEIREAADLAGKRVGVETSAVGAYVLARMLERTGMGSGDVGMVPLVVSETERAFRERRVDAVVTFEPTRTRLLKAGARLLFDSGRIPGEIVDVLIARPSTIARRRGELENLAQAWFLARDYLHAKPIEAARLMAPRLGLTASETSAAFELIHIPSAAENRHWLVGPEARLLSVGPRLAESMLLNGLISSAPTFHTKLFAYPLMREAR